MRKTFFALLFLIPVVTSAAGFARESLFLSKSPVVEGETVLVHVVLSNDTTEVFRGDMRLRVKENNIGVVSVTLAAGEARALSVSWTPEAGTHTVVAELRTSGGDVVEKEQATFVVKETPKTLVAGTSTTSAPVEPSTEIQQAIANISPQVAAGAEPLFTTLDSWRQTGADFLDTQIAGAKEHLPTGGILGAETAQEAKNNPLGSVVTVFQTLYFYILTLLRYLIASAILFYPLLVVLFIWGLWKLYQRMSRPRFR